MVPNLMSACLPKLSQSALVTKSGEQVTIMTSEAEKLSSHLALLRTEYVKLQQKCTKLERDLAVVSAQVRN